MTNDDRYIIKLNIAHYQAMLKLDLDDEKQATVERLLAQAEEVLTADSNQRSKDTDHNLGFGGSDAHI